MILSSCHGNSKTPIMKLLGPLDKRTLRTRCVACSLRKNQGKSMLDQAYAFDTYLFQCEGSPPCAYCTKKKQICISQNQLQSKTAKSCKFLRLRKEIMAFPQLLRFPSPPKISQHYKISLSKNSSRVLCLGMNWAADSISTRSSPDSKIRRASIMLFWPWVQHRQAEGHQTRLLTEPREHRNNSL